MKAYVTQAQFAAVRDAKLRFDNTRSPDDQKALSGLLSVCCLDNGGDYDPVLHRAGASVEVIVVTDGQPT